MSKKLIMTKNVLKRAGISDYSSVLSALDHTCRNVSRLHQRVNNVIYNGLEIEVLNNLHSAFHFLYIREQIECNDVFKNLVSEYEKVLEDNRQEGVRTLTVIIGSIGSGKTTLMNGLLDRVGLNSDALYVSDNIDYAQQILNINNSNAEMYNFLDFIPSIDKFKHKNIYIDSMYSDSLENIQPIFSFIQQTSDNIVITINTSETSKEYVKSCISILMKRYKLNLDLHILDVNGVCKKLSRYINE